jgi:putative lipoic acid-binding regulatory protein
MENKAAFYEKLKITLENTTKFPTEYMFKFILPTDEAKIEKIKNIFNYSGVIINTKPSKTGKYKSLTILVTMKGADEIIKKYKEVASVEGVISL